ncbi:MAG: type II toxin-antitoxin system VapC family toxin [Rhodomicrobium sp.]
MSVLLDTNVISELVRGVPDAGVVIFVSQLRSAFIPVMAVHEIEYGIELLPKGQRRAILEAGIANVLKQYSHAILPVERAEAELAARFRAEARQHGRVLHLPDALIAATAKEHGLTLATRNTTDFDYLGVAVIDPWALDPKR